MLIKREMNLFFAFASLTFLLAYGEKIGQNFSTVLVGGGLLGNTLYIFHINV